VTGSGTAVAGATTAIGFGIGGEDERNTIAFGGPGPVRPTFKVCGS
jgi:hypothetical protein